MDFKKVAKKWQARWEEENAFRAEDPTKSKKKPFYCLEMFPYPSGYLHMGHVRNYSLGDVYARYKRMRGFNVLYPMGYDSFGLPAENAAIQQGEDPQAWTEHNIKGIKEQQKLCGFSYDWTREIATSHPEYYRWNQWLFLKLFKRGLAYRKKSEVNWCPECETVLANEQVEDGRCWRHSDTEVEHKALEQWYLKTTAYADELLEGLEGLEWPDRVKTMQKNWIGKSKGATIRFSRTDKEGVLKTYTTRPDTIYGVTYLVIAPEHPLIEELLETQSQEKQEEVRSFIKEVKKQSTIERTREDKPKNGVPLGVSIKHPLTKQEIPLWVADYVLYEYGTGIVMAVPAHDQRDFEFAKKYDLPIKAVISPDSHELDPKKMARAYTDEGVLINSEGLDGTRSEDAIKAVTKKLEEQDVGEQTTNYKLRDWLVSRQRYWGTPIPIIYCNECGAVPAREEDLPIRLPTGADFNAGGNPLETVDEFTNTTCPECKQEARRETDTMDTFFDSSWYFLRFCDPHNKEKPFDKQKASEFMPVNQYIGGIEHAILHLLYARFFTKVLRDEKMIDVDEPFTRLLTLGMINKDGKKMSKSVGNVVDPGEMIDSFGQDTVRFFMLFGALPEKELEWSEDGAEATHRFLQRVAKLPQAEYGEGGRREDAYITSKQHSTIRAVTELVEEIKYSTALQHVMSFANTLHKYSQKPVTKTVWDDALKTLTLLLAPFTPHLAEELWEETGHEGLVSLHEWPEYDESLIDEEAEAVEELLEQTKDDIRTVLKLAKIEGPKTITLYLPAVWKYDLIKKVKEALEETSNPKEIIGRVMQDEKLKKQGTSVTKIIPSLLKDRSKIPKTLFTQEEEQQHYEAMKEELAETFGCEVEVSDAREQGKGAQGMPGKPAIEVS